MTSGTLAAVDLGASSGRVVVGHVGPDELRLEEVHRFVNAPVSRPDGLHWDAELVRREVVDGLRRAARSSPGLVSVGVDGWGVDYGLLDASGALVDEPYHYRDERNAVGVDAVHRVLDRPALYARNGLQFLPFNTLYQLAADRSSAARRDARTMLLMPDLVGYWLTGVAVAERTNASTTGLLDPATRDWAWDVIDRLDFRRDLFVGLRDAGEVLGPVSPDVAAEDGRSARSS